MFLFIIFLLSFFLVWGLVYFGVFEVCLDRTSLDFAEALIMFDGVSILCLLMLFFCGTAALLYCGHYFSSDLLGGVSLRRVLVLFLGVMCFLVLSYNLLGTLVLWEYLGLVSFFLILFYSNLDSLRATLITVFASRFGDVCLFGLILFIWFRWEGGSFLFSLLLLFIVLTKSACFPFVSWLLEAMRAPTPVSSLVHSSTLVAAGVWFLFRYGGSGVLLSPSLEFVFFFLSLSTILISSISSVVFLDLKKIVALSTCNNVSWCILFFLMGDVFLGLFQLLSHGVAKCYLFISLGDLMSGSSSAQDSRGVYSAGYSGFLSLGLQSILILSLCGVPFMGIFFSKHGLVSEFLWSYGSFSYILLFFSFLMSYVYSFRLLGLLSGFNSFGVYMYGSLFLFILMISLLSGFLNFFSLGGSEELFLLGGVSSIFLLFIQVLGSLLGVYFYFNPIVRGFSVFGFFLWGCDALVGVFYYLFSYCYHLFLFLLYRWEVSSLSYLSFVLKGFSVYLGSGWLSLKFLVLSGTFLLGLCFVLS